MDEKPIDLFRSKHQQFLHEIERVWPRYRPIQGELEIFLERGSPLPPNWIRRSLRIGACDLSGNNLVLLRLDWTDLEGSVLRAVVRPCPVRFRTRSVRALVPIGDFVLCAGDFERLIPNQFSLTESDPIDHDPRGDRLF